MLYYTINYNSIHIYIYIYIHTYIHTYIYLYIYREREREIHRNQGTSVATPVVPTKSSDFQFESLKSAQINCGFFLTRCRISMCQGLGPKKHGEISEIDRRRRPCGTNIVLLLD